MIQPHEFRIGNWFQYRSQLLDGIQYRKICNGGDIDLWRKHGTAEPIPLTDDILNHAFASKGEGNYFIEDECVYIGKDTNGEYRLTVEPSDPYYMTQIGVPIKYVHQLQNQFFSLTGQELEIKIATLV